MRNKRIIDMQHRQRVRLCDLISDVTHILCYMIDELGRSAKQWVCKRGRIGYFHKAH